MGMDREEFLDSSMAQILALRTIHKKQERQRSYYGAQIAAAVLNTRRGIKKGDKLWEVEELMPHFRSVVTTDQHDPDRGAAGDWKGFKQSLKQTTEKAKGRRARRPRAMTNAKRD